MHLSMMITWSPDHPGTSLEKAWTVCFWSLTCTVRGLTFFGPCPQLQFVRPGLLKKPGLSNQDCLKTAALLIGLSRVPYGQESSRAVLEITIPFEERIRGQNIEGVLSGASHLTEVTSLLWLPSLTGNAGRHKPSLNRALSANLETTAAWVSCRDLAERKTWSHWAGLQCTLSLL